MELLLQILDKYGEKEMYAFIRKRIMPCRKQWDDPKKWPVLVKKYRKKYRLAKAGQAQPAKAGNMIQ
jgi:hypothetical protein